MTMYGAVGHSSRQRNLLVLDGMDITGFLASLFVPLNEKRDALVRDEKGEPLVWVVQMESAGEALKQGITLESFPRGVVICMGVHPRRDGKPAGDRGDSGIFQCPKGSVPKP